MLIERQWQEDVRLEEVPLHRPWWRLSPPVAVYQFSKAVNALPRCVRGKSGVDR